METIIKNDRVVVLGNPKNYVLNDAFTGRVVGVRGVRLEITRIYPEATEEEKKVEMGKIEKTFSGCQK